MKKFHRYMRKSKFKNPSEICNKIENKNITSPIFKNMLRIGFKIKRL